MMAPNHRKPKLNPLTLVFEKEAKPLEKTFRSELHRKSLNHIRIAFIFGLVIYNTFGVLDWIVMPEMVFWPWVIRYAVFTPIIIGLLILTFSDFFVRNYQLMVSIPILIGGIGIVAMITIATPSVSSSYYAGLILVFFYGYTFMRARFIYASATSLVIVVAYEVTTMAYTKPPMQVLVGNNFFFLSANVMGMFSCYLMEYAARCEYYIDQLLKAEQNKVIDANIKLSSLNSKLQLLSDIDDLTQIANRRLFDESLTDEWARSARHQNPLALIMCDIDFFKLYNDRYGHQKGDDCLKKVAQTLKQATRRPADLVARYGGEEFMLLLPETDDTGAQIVAQNILKTIAQLKIIHEESPISNMLTLSMGITAMVPAGDFHTDILIARVDEALYLAKSMGRNQYVTLPSVPSAQSDR